MQQRCQYWRQHNDSTVRENICELKYSLTLRGLSWGYKNINGQIYLCIRRTDDPGRPLLSVRCIASLKINGLIGMDILQSPDQFYFRVLVSSHLRVEMEARNVFVTNIPFKKTVKNYTKASACQKIDLLCLISNGFSCEPNEVIG